MLRALSSRHRQLLFIVGITFLLFFRASSAFVVQLPSYDDGGYLQWVYRWLGEPFPYQVRDTYFPGTAVLWIPAGIAAKLVAWARGVTGLEPWLSIFIALTSFLCWAVALFAVDSYLESYGLAPGWSLLVLLNIPVLYYATSRTHLAHASEAALVLLFLLALQRQRFGIAMALTVLTVATRINDAPILFVLIGAILDARAITSRSRRNHLALCILVSLPLLYLLAFQGYQGITLFTLAGRVSRYQFVHLMASPHWGLIWTAGWWLWCLWDGLYFFTRLTHAGRAAVIWMTLELLAYCAWPSDGSDFGYRYLIGSYAGALVVWIETRKYVPRGAPRFSRALLVVGGVWMTLLTWIYRTAPHYTVAMQAQTLQRLSHPLTLLYPLGLSPLGLVFYSRFWRNSWFLPFSHWGNYALTPGPALYALLALSGVAVLLVVGSHTPRRT